MRPLKDGCRPHREIQFALVAAVEPTLASRNAILTGARWAGNPIGPKTGLKVNPCCLLVGEHCEKLKGRNCALAHELIVDNSLEGVKYPFVILRIYFQFLRGMIRQYRRQPLSSLISYTTPSKALIMTDTLAVIGDKACKFTTKAHIVPHLKIIIVGTGVGGFADRWALYVNTESNATGIDALDTEATNVLPRMWTALKQQFGIVDSRTATIYHFGLSERTGKIRTFVYFSETDFASEEKGYGYMTKPPLDIGSQYELPQDAKLLMEKQRQAQLQLPKPKRVYIGGRIQVHRLTKTGYRVSTQATFDDFASDQKAIFNHTKG